MSYLEEMNRKRKDPPDSPYRELEKEILKDARTTGVPEAELSRMLNFVGFQTDDLHSSHWSSSRAAASELAELGRARHFKVFAAIFPFMLDVPRYALTSVHRYVGQEFKALGIDCIDLLDTGKEINSQLGSDGSRDSVHFGVKGSAMIAEELYRQLQGTVDSLSAQGPAS